MEWISRSNAMQRAGRAGRVQKGECWHMFSRKKFENLSEYLDPDIKRLQLEDVILNVKSLNLKTGDAKQFMENLVEPPRRTSVHDALSNLIK